MERGRGSECPKQKQKTAVGTTALQHKLCLCTRERKKYIKIEKGERDRYKVNIFRERKLRGLLLQFYQREKEESRELQRKRNPKPRRRGRR